MANTLTANLPLKAIVLTGLVAGTLDASAAIIILAHGNATGVFRYIATAVFGPEASVGGAGMVAWGVFFHYFIALCWTVLYFLAYPRVGFLRKNKWVSGLLYGVFVWCVMTLVVVPLTLIPHRALTAESALKNMAILMVCIGLPIAWGAEWWGRRK